MTQRPVPNPTDPNALPPYTGGGRLADTMALRRAEYFAQQAEQLLDENSKRIDLDNWPNVARALAEVSQAWAFIAITYQGPESNTGEPE